jgi:hypothetical protein
MALDESLVLALRAVEPYLADILLAGGWVPHVYAALHAPADGPTLLVTRDVDLAIARHLPARGQNVDALLEAAGFDCEFRSLDSPPVTVFVASRGDSDEVEVEFITTARGSVEEAVNVQGVTAQGLRYVELLLENVWAVPLADLTDGELRGELRLPTPAAFIVHKGLTYRRRRDVLKREKDLYYAFYVLAAFPDWRESIRSDLAGIAMLRPKWIKRLRSDVGTAFAGLDSAGTLAVAHQRPASAFPGLTDEQFRQYVVTTMSGWLEMLRAPSGV